MGLSCSPVSDRILFSDPVDEEKKSMLLVMRVLSIVPLNFKVRVIIIIKLFFRVGGERFGDSRTKIEPPPTVKLMRIFFTAYAMVRSVVPGTIGVQLVCPIPNSSAENITGGNFAEHASSE